MNDWVSLVQAIVWPITVFLVAVLARKHLIRLLDAIAGQIEGGRDLSGALGPLMFTLSTAPRLPAEVTVPANDGAIHALATPGLPAATPASSQGFHLIHAAQRDANGPYTVRVQLLTDNPLALERVTRVVYHLHPQLPQPVQESSNRSSNFELVFQSPGQFDLQAEVFLKGMDTPLQLTRYLNF